MADRSFTGSVPQSDGSTINRIHHFKLVLLGEASVGKSSLVLRFVKGQFRDALESTIGGKQKIHRPCVYSMLLISLSVTKTLCDSCPWPWLTAAWPCACSYQSISQHHKLKLVVNVVCFYLQHHFMWNCIKS